MERIGLEWIGPQWTDQHRIGKAGMGKLTCVRTKYQPERTYEEFLEERHLGWGSSDIGSLIGESEYGCKRRLFLERLGLMPESKNDSLRFHLERGKFFEAPVADLYAQRTGRQINLVGGAYIQEFPFLRANSDRLISGFAHEGKERNAGCLEIKVPGMGIFKKIQKEGLPKAWILQLQWQMLCYGTSWGSFAVYWADGHALEWFDVERDEELILGLIIEAKTAWALLEKVRGDIERGNVWKYAAGFPEKLDPYARACARCPMYQECHAIEFKQGVVIENAGLAPAAQALLEVRAAKKALEKQEEELKAQIESEFSQMPCDYIQAGSYKVTVSERSREVISPKVKECLTESDRLLYVRNTQFNVITIKEA